LKTYLAIFLETLGTLAAATHVVTRLRRHVLGHRLGAESRLEGIRILGLGILYGLVTNRSSSRRVAAFSAVAILAEFHGRKTFTVQLEALGLFAIARTALGRGCRFLVLLASGRWNGTCRRTIPRLGRRARIITVMGRRRMRVLAC